MKQERQVWRSGKAYPVGPDYHTPIEKAISSASVASDSPNQSNETRAVLHVGDKVSFDHYGERKTGVIGKLGKSLVFLTDGRWLHRQSVISD